jgi:hypothetical protein
MLRVAFDRTPSKPGVGTNRAQFFRRDFGPGELPLRDPQRSCLKFVRHLLFGEFFGREVSDALDRHGIILERQAERPGAVLVADVLHVTGDGAVGDLHGVDIIKIRNYLVPQRSKHEDRFTNRWNTPGGRWLHLVSARCEDPPRQLHDWPGPMGGVWCDCGGGRTRAVARCEETDVEGLA